MLQLKNSVNNFIINAPTKIEEIDSKYLVDCVKHVTLSENYAIIALVLSTKLTDFCFSLGNNNNKDGQMSVTPLFVKANPSKDVAFKADTCDLVIIHNEDLSRSYHLNVPSSLTSQSIGSYIKSDSDYCKKIITGEIKDNEGHKLGDNIIRMLQFKIVPINDIHATMKPITSKVDKYVETISTGAGK